MKIFKRIQRWLCPPKLLITSEQIEDLLKFTIMKLITKNFHLAFGTKRQYLLAWIGNRYCPISFNVVTLFKHVNSAQDFVNYVTSQLRKAGIEL